MRERQLTLDLPLHPRLGREDFLPSPASEAALAMLDRWPDWPDPVLVLIGPEGAGKSHLATIWAAEVGALRIDALALGDSMPKVAAGVPLLIEDADRARLPEAGFFHLLNLVRNEKASLLVTARRAPDHWGLRTADLLSRLRLAPQVAIAAPDETLMHAVLVKLFADRQLRVDAGVIAFLAMRLERSLGAARAVVAALDQASLTLGRRVTRPLAGKVLEALHPTSSTDSPSPQI